ncbi:hypothetical protein CTAYLR_000958 [Chrysophaeum taylorii]|uniref:Sulfatase N-terminal domain-containing protein n=1 Tax=Chrysophaeum taylorii TaxID=2483200 RepID=A0AAD7UFE2_9STRA|nr:hypothetical protein CTAYLR_000958 [Chrysophaeum taylorii]
MALLLSRVAGLFVVASGDNKKNVLLLVADDLRPELGAYGSSWMVTPHLDALARESLVFDAAFSNFAICSPSRNSWMSGRMPDITRTWNFIDDFRHSGQSRLASGEEWTSLPQFFKSKNYSTLGHGKLYHPGKPPNNDEPYSWTDPYVELVTTSCGNGEHFCPREGASDDEFSDYNTTIRALERLQAATAPWFVGLGLHFPHLSWATPLWCVDAYENATIEIAKFRDSPEGCPDVAFTAEIDGAENIKLNMSDFPTTTTNMEGVHTFPVPIPGNNSVPPEVDWLMRLGYYSAVTHTDWLFGKMIDAAAPTKNETVLVVTADHGYQLGERGEWAKHTLFDNALRVPLLIRAPWAREMMGKRTPAYFELIDLYRTLVTLAGHSVADVEPDVDGLDQSELVSDPDARPSRDAAFAQYSRCPQSGGVPAYHKNNCEHVVAANISVMGYTLREPLFRFTDWYEFRNCQADFDAILATELYALQPPNATIDFDMGDNRNLAALDSFGPVVARLRGKLRTRFDIGGGTTNTTAHDDNAQALFDDAVLVSIVMAAMRSMLRVAIIGSIGGALAICEVLDTHARKSLARLLTYALLPLLLFTKGSAAVNRAMGPALLHWLIVPAYAAIHVGLGLAIAAVTGCRRRRTFSPLPSTENEPPDLRGALVTLAVAFPNSGSLPLALVEPLCATIGCDVDAAVGYVSFYIAALNPILWVVCPRLLLRQYPTDDAAFSTRRWLQSIPPPAVAAVGGAFFGAVPRLYDLALRDTVLGSALDLVANSAVPIGIINLGAAIAASARRAKDPAADAIGAASLAKATFFRLLFVPALSIAATYNLRAHNVFIPKRNIPLALVLMLESCSPPAMQLIIFLQLFNLTHLERPMAQLLVVMYLISLLTLTAWIAIILAVLTLNE